MLYVVTRLACVNVTLSTSSLESRVACTKEANSLVGAMEYNHHPWYVNCYNKVCKLINNQLVKHFENMLTDIVHPVM